jgi:ABC-type polysaccharide/polyol phosphate export permease
MSLNLALHPSSAPPLAADIEVLPVASRTAEALADLAAGLARSWIWSALAYQDIKLRYRGSLLGPFWVTLTTLILVVAMGGIYGALFHIDTATYVPFLMCGLSVWQFISTIATEGCATFTAAQDVIQQVPLPFSIQAYRTVYRNLIVLAHNAVIIPFGLVIFDVPVSWHLLEIVPALLLLCLNGLWISLLLGTVSTRFRDVPPIVANFVQVIFFVTPIFWPLASAGSWGSLLALNPVFAAIDVIRAPLLGGPPEVTSWPILLACTLIGSLGSLAVFVRFRERIAYWI